MTNGHAALSESEAWALLSALGEGPCPPVADFATAVGPKEAAHRLLRRDPAVPPEALAVTEARAAALNIDDGRLLVDSAARCGFRIIYPRHPEWPAAAFAGFPWAQSACRPDLVDQCFSPYALWVAGTTDLSEAPRVGLGVVGTRAPGNYGLRVTRDLTSAQAVRRIIVSGGALGVDATAHEIAMARGGTTVAVTACGCDRAYPAAHRELFARIAESGARGAVITEYPPGTRPARHRFLARNRLIAALSAGVVVTAAGWRSGAINTAGWSHALGRTVMAVPGPIDDVETQGCHRLLRDHMAELVGRSDDIDELLGPVEAATPSLFELVNGSSTQRGGDGLAGAELAVFDALHPSRPATPGDILRETGLPAGRVATALRALARSDRAELREQGWIRRPLHTRRHSL